jgi:serine/threonine protein kinase
MGRSTDFEGLDVLTGTTILSEVDPRVHFRLEQCVGAGGVGVAFLALRIAPGSVSPVVIKVLRPSVVEKQGPTASASIKKEAVALGRINEHVPPSPFVVRFVDTGVVRSDRLSPMPLPWIAIEHVHGGEEGTTLEDRVTTSIKATGFAFDPRRAGLALRCLAGGISAIHDVSVFHRDVTPGNVLCCSFGDAEIFKISDFGLSRSAGMVDTFGNVFLGTPGYAAPEQSFAEDTGVGPHTDVFSLAGVMYFVLTGETYFNVRTIPQAFVAARDAARRSLNEAKRLHPELRDRPEDMRAIDQVFAKATSYAPSERPQTVRQFASLLAPLLRDGAASGRPSQRAAPSAAARPSPSRVADWVWTIRHPPGDDRVIRSAAWDGDGSCLAATTRGIEFWDGVQWLIAKGSEIPVPGVVRFASRVGPGSWLVGGDEGTLAVYTFEGVREVIRCPDKTVSFSDGDGRAEDLLVAVAERGGDLELWAMAARRWLKPLPLPGIARVAAISRFDDASWLLAGRSKNGAAFAALYRPLRWEIQSRPAPTVRAFVACSAEPERQVGIVAGSGGYVIRAHGDAFIPSQVPDGRDLSAAAIDVFDRQWVARAGRIWLSEQLGGAQWIPVWDDPTWQVPFVRLLPGAGMLLALSADGGVVEGRTGWKR